MTPTAHFRPLALCVLIAIGCAGNPGASRAGPWSFTLGAGAAGTYQFSSQPYADQLGPTWTAAAAVMHAFNPALALRVGAGWSRREREVGTAGIPEDPSPQLLQRVDVVPLTAGVRWRSARNDRPFLDLAPALVWSSWHQRVRQVGQGMNGYFDTDVTTTRSTFSPGIEVGFGADFELTDRVRPEFGVHYLAAIGPSEPPLPSLAGQHIDGVRQWTAVVSVGLTK
jgi:hypothetical protein